MVLSRRWALVLLAVGIWSWVIWPRFVIAIWRDPRSWHGDTPTSFWWVHAALIVVSLVLGTLVGGLGFRAWWAARRGPADLT